jgi:hypothetical protein
MSKQQEGGNEERKKTKKNEKKKPGTTINVGGEQGRHERVLVGQRRDLGAERLHLVHKGIYGHTRSYKDIQGHKDSAYKDIQGHKDSAYKDIQGHIRTAHIRTYKVI